MEHERKRGGKYQSIADFLTRINIKDLNRKSMEALIKAGVFDKLEERNKLLKNLDRLLEYARQAQKTKLNGQQGLFDGLANVPKIYLEPAKEATLKEKPAPNFFSNFSLDTLVYGSIDKFFFLFFQK